MEYIDRQKQRIQRALKEKRNEEQWNEVHEQLLAVQKKSMQISSPGDSDEKEADEVSRKIMNGESAEIHGTGGTINRKGEGSAETTPEFQAKLESNKGAGQSLDDSSRSEMESKMGANFSGVKIHTGSEAQTMSENINAKAFTHGQDIFFNQGQFNPQSAQGKELLAHELTHTVQQGHEQSLVQRDHTGPEGLIPNAGKPLTQDESGSIGYMTTETEYAEKYKDLAPEAKAQKALDFILQGGQAGNLLANYYLLTQKKSKDSEGKETKESYWDLTLTIKAKADAANPSQHPKEGQDKPAAETTPNLRGIHLDNYDKSGRTDTFKNTSADWGQFKPYNSKTYNKSTYPYLDQMQNYLLDYTLDKSYGFGSMMVMEDRPYAQAGGQPGTTMSAKATELLNSLPIGTSGLTLDDPTNANFKTLAVTLLTGDSSGTVFASLMATLRDFSTTANKVMAAVRTSDQTGLPVNEVMALYGQEGYFTMPASTYSIKNDIPVTERGGLSRVSHKGQFVDMSTNLIVIKKGSTSWTDNSANNRFSALIMYAVQVAGLDVLDTAVKEKGAAIDKGEQERIEKEKNAGVAEADIKPPRMMELQDGFDALAEWSAENRWALRKDEDVKVIKKEERDAETPEKGKEAIKQRLDAEWKKYYNQIIEIEKVHKKDEKFAKERPGETNPDKLDEAYIYTPSNPSAFVAFILTEAALYFKRFKNDYGKDASGGLNVQFTAPIAYLMYNTTDLKHGDTSVIGFLVQAVQAVRDLTINPPPNTAQEALGLTQELKDEVAKLKDTIDKTTVRAWLKADPKRWGLLMYFMEHAGQQSLQTSYVEQSSGNKKNNFIKQINSSNFRTLSEFYKDVYTPTVQPKSLDINKAGDASEKEADEVARKVVNGQTAEIHGNAENIQRKEAGGTEASPEFQSKLETQNGSGQSLDDSTRQEMESKMGADFEGVKIHTGGEAHSMNEDINAKAFTHGSDIYFRQGEFNTDSKQGKELLAHELTHTVQQGSGKVKRKIQRQGYEPGTEYTEGQMRQNFNLHNDDRSTMQTRPGGTEQIYFREGDTVTFESTTSDSFWVKVKGIAYYTTDTGEQSAGEQSGWVRRNVTTMTKGVYTGLDIVDRSKRQPVKLKEDAFLYTSGFAMQTFSGKNLYFKKDESVIMGDIGTQKTGTGEVKWNEVEGVAYQKINDVETALPSYMKGFVKMEQLDVTAATDNSLGNIGVNKPYQKIKTITLHQTGSDSNDPMSNNSKIGTNNQFGNYMISSTGQVSLITPINEQMSHNPASRIKKDLIKVTKPAPDPANVPPTNVFDKSDKSFETKMKAVRTEIENDYKDGTISKETCDFWLNIKTNTMLFDELEKTSWHMLLPVSYNLASVGIEVVGAPLDLGIPADDSATTVNAFRDSKIKDSTKFSPNYKAQLMAMKPAQFKAYMVATGGIIYGDISGEQKYASWLLVNALVGDLGLGSINAQTVVGHDEVDQKKHGEGTANKEFLLSMVAYKKTLSDLGALTGKMTTDEKALYDSELAVMVLVDGATQLKTGDEGYVTVVDFFNNFYARRDAMVKMLEDVKAR